MVHQESKNLECLHLDLSFHPRPPSMRKESSKSTKELGRQYSAQVYSQVTMNESIDLRHAPMIDSSQNNYKENHHERWKPPAEKAEEQAPPLRVLVIHHQYVPEVHRLWKETRWPGSELMTQDSTPLV